MIDDMKKAFQEGMKEIIEDVLLEQSKVKFIEKLGEIGEAVADLREKITVDHLDPSEFSPEELMESLEMIMEKRRRLDDDRDN